MTPGSVPAGKCRVVPSARCACTSLPSGNWIPLRIEIHVRHATAALWCRLLLLRVRFTGRSRRLWHSCRRCLRCRRNWRCARNPCPTRRPGQLIEVRHVHKLRHDRMLDLELLNLGHGLSAFDRSSLRERGLCKVEHSLLNAQTFPLQGNLRFIQAKLLLGKLELLLKLRGPLVDLLLNLIEPASSYCLMPLILFHFQILKIGHVLLLEVSIVGKTAFGLFSSVGVLLSGIGLLLIDAKLPLSNVETTALIGSCLRETCHCFGLLLVHLCAFEPFLWLHGSPTIGLRRACRSLEHCLNKRVLHDSG